MYLSQVRVRLLLEGRVPVLQLLGHQLELVPLFSAVVQLLAQNQQRLGFALQLAPQGSVLKEK